jgi:hypothetical protein
MICHSPTGRSFSDRGQWAMLPLIVSPNRDRRSGSSVIADESEAVLDDGIVATENIQRQAVVPAQPQSEDRSVLALVSHAVIVDARFNLSRTLHQGAPSL